MPGRGGESITYKSIVVTLLSVVIALISFIGVGALNRLDRLELAVSALQANKLGDNWRMSQLESRMSQIEKLLLPQIDYLTKWLEDTFGQPKPKSKVQFGRQ